MIWPYPIPGPLDKLQSLLLPEGHGHIQADANFWSTHRSLHFLGVSSKEFHVVDNLPSNHPFSHLLWIDAMRALLNAQDITNTVRRLPNLRSTTLAIYTRPLQSEYLDKLLSIQITQWRSSVRWLDLEGNEIRFRELRRQNGLRKWEGSYLLLNSSQNWT